MKIALFCGNGTISTQLRNFISKSHHEIMVFSRTPLKNLDPRFFSLIDFHHSQSYQESLRLFRPDAVYSSIWCHRQEDYTNARVNKQYFQSTLELFQISDEIGIRTFFCVGSSAELTNSELSTYGFYKKKLRDEILDMSTIKTQVSWLRPFNVYGHNQPNFSILNSILNCIRENRVIFIRHPNRQFDWITSRDVARGILTAFNDRILGVHDLGTGQSTSIENFVSEVLSQLRLSTSKYVEFGTESKKTTPLIANCSSTLHKKWRAFDSIEAGIRWSLQEWDI